MKHTIMGPNGVEEFECAGQFCPACRIYYGLELKEAKMKKPYRFHEMSNVTCDFPGCTRRIKKNVVERKSSGRPLHCYKCHTQLTRGKRNKTPQGGYKQALSPERPGESTSPGVVVVILTGLIYRGQQLQSVKR